MATKKDYNEMAGKAVRWGLLELGYLWGEYHEDMVLAAGWVPEFILAAKIKPYCGGIDVDLAPDHRRLQERAAAVRQPLCLSPRP